MGVPADHHFISSFPEHPSQEQLPQAPQPPHPRNTPGWHRPAVPSPTIGHCWPFQEAARRGHRTPQTHKGTTLSVKAHGASGSEDLGGDWHIGNQSAPPLPHRAEGLATPSAHLLLVAGRFQKVPTAPRGGQAAHTEAQPQGHHAASFPHPSAQSGRDQGGRAPHSSKRNTPPKWCLKD